MRSESSSSTSVFETPAAWTRTSFSPLPLDVGAEIGEQREHRVDVADARDVAQHDRLVGEQARGEDRQRAVLVAGGPDASR